MIGGQHAEALFEESHPPHERFERPLFVELAEAHERNLDVDSRIRGLPHVDESPAERLEGAGDRCRRHPLGQVGGPGPFMLGRPRRRVSHCREEGVAQAGQHHLADGARVPAASCGFSDC